MENPMHVAYITDDKYAMPTLVSIISMRKNKNIDDVYYVHILCDGISPDSKNKLKSAEAIDFYVDIIEMTNTEILDGFEIPNLHVSTSALYKFSIANIFPSLNKVIYLDGDTLIQKSLRGLYDIDISEYYAAVVRPKADDI